VHRPIPAGDGLQRSPSTSATSAIYGASEGGRGEEKQKGPGTKIPSDQLDSLVAPLALYPDADAKPRTLSA